MLSPKENWCRVLIMSNPSMTKVRWLKFKTEEIFPLYDTAEEIEPLEDKNGKPTKEKKKV